MKPINTPPPPPPRYSFECGLLPLPARIVPLGLSMLLFLMVFSQASIATTYFAFSANTPITFTESVGMQGNYFTGNCTSCVEGLFGPLPSPVGLSLNAFDMVPVTPVSSIIQSGTNGLMGQIFRGDTSFTITNPDGSPMISAPTTTPVQIQFTPNDPTWAMITFQIPGPVSINDVTNVLGLGPNYVVNGPLYEVIAGYTLPNTVVSTGLVGPSYDNCQSNNPAPYPYCQESILGFTIDATIEASTSPITYASLFPGSTVSVPEPVTLSLVSLGLACLSASRSRCKAG